jgi:orotidine-5'-phosphate decarboxylase
MPSITKRTYADRAAAHPIPVAQQLLAVCDRKQTNLCVSVDVTSKQSLLRIADAAGPYCCCIKVGGRRPPSMRERGKSLTQ